MFILYHKEQQLYTSGVAISHPRLATLPDPAPSLKSSQYRMNLPTRNPTVHLTHQGNLKSQSFFSKQNPLHTYVAMYSFSTESHVPRDDRFLFYDPDRYYHFLKKQESHDAKLRKNSTMGVQGSGHNTSLGDAILESADELSELGETDSNSENDDDDYSDEEDAVTLSQLAAMVTPEGKDKKRKVRTNFTSLKERGGRVGGRGGGRSGNASSTASRGSSDKSGRGRPPGSKNKKTLDNPAKSANANTTLTNLGKIAAKTGQSSLLASFKTAAAAKNAALKVKTTEAALPTLGKASQIPIPNFTKKSTASNHAPATKAMEQKAESTSQEIVETTFIIRAVYRRKLHKNQLMWWI